MTNSEYVAVVRLLGYNIFSVAPVLGVSARMSRYYASGKFPVPKPIAFLLAARLALRETQQMLRLALGLERDASVDGSSPAPCASASSSLPAP